MHRDLNAEGLAMGTQGSTGCWANEEPAGQDGCHLRWEQGRSVNRVGRFPHSERQGADPETLVQRGGPQAPLERLTRQRVPAWCSRPRSDQRTPSQVPAL